MKLPFQIAGEAHAQRHRLDPGQARDIAGRRRRQDGGQDLGRGGVDVEGRAGRERRDKGREAGIIRLGHAAHEPQRFDPVDRPRPDRDRHRPVGIIGGAHRPARLHDSRDLGAERDRQRGALADGLIGAGAGAFLAIRWIHAALRGREGLGLGDVKRMAGIGAALGWAALPLVALLAALAALAVAGLGRPALTAETEIPFGACLAASAAVLWMAAAG